jgi:hypothetical protein
MDTAAMKDIEVQLKGESGKAVIEGKTAVPFQAFVALILQRKVFSLLKKWGNEPIVVGSQLLTSLASAPQDSPENRAKLVTVSLGVGVLLGFFLACLLLVGLSWLGYPAGNRELMIVAGSIAAIAFVAVCAAQLQQRKRSDKVVETMEKITAFFS